MEKGKLIVIEGTDASGKETQTKLLVDRLTREGIPCATMSFPRYDLPTGRIIGECYLGKTGDSWFGDNANLVPAKVASLYYAADREFVSPELTELLKQGKHVILNRYVESNMAHQGGKLKGEEQLELFNFINDLEYGLLKIPKPDSVFLLYMPYKVGMKLKKSMPGKADTHESNPEHLKNAEECYLNLAGMFGWIGIDCAPDGTINSLRTKEDIAEEVYQHAINEINSSL